MIDVQVHFRGAGREQQRLPALPPVGSYLVDADGKLWVVGAVVFGQRIDVYCARVCDALAVELQQQWGTWGEATEVGGEVRVRNP